MNRARIIKDADDQRSGYDSGGVQWSRTKRIKQIDVTYNDGQTVQPTATYGLTFEFAGTHSGERVVPDIRVAVERLLGVRRH
jgi:hypothetical protein